jgi:membrane protein implicated in regulation of membrane protease activity
MSTRTALAVLAIAVLLGITIYGLMSGVFLTGSGGLGAVSVGVCEALLEFLALSALVCLFFYWRHRRQRRRQPDRPATRA